jgi:hypothetical protein
VAILLQRIESYNILDCIAPKIVSEFSGLEFITKHDSLLPAGIMVTGEVEKIKLLTSEEIKKTVGFSPQIKNQIIIILYYSILSFHISIYTPISYSNAKPNSSTFHYVCQNLVIN